MFIKKRKNERGQAIVMIAMAIIGLVGMTALAIDGGYAFANNRQAQNAADNAALSAALSKVRGSNNAAIIAMAKNLATSNGFDDTDTSITVTVNNPPLNGAYAGDSDYIQVIVTSQVDTFFAPVVGVDQITNTVEAVARAKPPVDSEMYFGNAVVSLKPTGTKTFWLNGNPDITTIGGGFFTNSSTDCGFRANGSPTFTVPNNTMVAADSCPHYSDSGTNYEAPEFDYPPPDYMFPDYTCDYNHSGNFPGGTTNLAAGIHCVNGNFRLNGNDTLTGTGVTIVMESGTVHLNGNGVLNLTAPASGSTEGLLLYMPMSNTSGIKINGTSNQLMSGTIFAPSSAIEMLGTADTNAFQTQVIGYEIQFSGTFDGTIRYNDAQNHDITLPPEISLAY